MTGARYQVDYHSSLIVHSANLRTLYDQTGHGRHLRADWSKPDDNGQERGTTEILPDVYGAYSLQPLRSRMRGSPYRNQPKDK